MKTLTHTLFGIFVVLWLYIQFPALQNYSPFLFGIALAAFGATMPDIDHGRELSFFVKHRGWIHSLFGAIFFTLLFGWGLVIMSEEWFKTTFKFSYILPFFISYISHLVIDSLTPNGVNWLWPKKEKYTLNLIVTGSKTEKFFSKMIELGIVIELFYIFIYTCGFGCVV